MLVYRIVHEKYSKTLFASGLEGRWNSEGKKVLYTAESISLAYLETMNFRKGFGFNNDFKIMVIQLPTIADCLIVESSHLPKSWRDFRNYQNCQEIGDQWFDAAKDLALKVPSAVVPENFNVVINTLHPAYKKVKLIDILGFYPDERLELILKKYK
ncbi:RES domain-containing protein [Kaistella flava (ex Peng et al. 2021)]|uniref:RES domain-containing protein n=1 Tax=Kaistella flava (ex Peng et al. 2021) TaxID=2038776 RepID=A0A7M2Y6U7_9FLAO|nr:RES family NAD+ phosphorylase [Kaistella flava (ex Peng et al. 2021)]QOW09355.1 RES domain-containing protein [Kaistella flava (ex Peng et al. 2021)]